MANVIPSALKVDVILDEALRAFSEALLPIRAFANVLNDVPLKGTNKIAVPFYPLAATTTRDFAGTYVMDGSEVQVRDVTVNKRKYQSMSFTSDEYNRQPFLNPEEIGRVKGLKLAEDVLTDILSVVTDANYGTHILSSTAGNFDSDDVADMKGALDAARWPKMQRTLILDTTFETALLKDDAIKAAYASGTTDPLWNGKLPTIAGFEVIATNVIPANGEKLIGMAVIPSAILVALSPIEPAPGVRAQLSDYRTVSDPQTGITLEYRAWGDPDTDTAKAVIECNYGYNFGQAEALKRIVIP
jgi:hypothetical protein